MLNCIIIQGRLKDDVELRYTQSNMAVCSAVLAVQRSRKASNGEYPVDWIDVVFWGKTAEHVHQWFHKGDMAVVRGRLEAKRTLHKSRHRTSIRTSTSRRTTIATVLFRGDRYGLFAWC